MPLATEMAVPALPGAQAFLQALNPAQQAWLQGLRSHAMQSPQADYLPWFCGSQHLGWLAPPRAHWLAQHLPDCRLKAHGLVWQAQALNGATRSALLQAAVLQARSQGLLTGWRDERFCFWNDGQVLPGAQSQARLDVERAGFRFLGLLSHAVHVNGFVPDGRLWVARRALSKATDPGLLDNVTAGGLPSGESVRDCLQRELAEEAGLMDLQGLACVSAGWVRSARQEPQGWHDEVIHVFNLGLAPDFVPRNQDGEVAAFMCLEPAAVLAQMQAQAFTVDAALSLVEGLWPQAGAAA